MEENIVAVDERQIRNQEEGVSTLDSQLMVLSKDESEPMAICQAPEVPPASSNNPGESPENGGGQQEGGGSRLDSELMVVSEDEAEPMAIAETTEIPPASGYSANELPENDASQTETSRRRPTGPKTLAGKKKTRLNAPSRHQS
jgi:hypothetical protein